MTAVTIRDLMTDPDLFGHQFAGDNWQAWRGLLSAFYGLSLTDDEAETFKRIAGGLSAPDSALDELFLVVGRRGGKSQMAALLAVFESAFRNYADRLSPGEVATVMVLAADRKQARTVFRYIAGLLHSNPMLERLIAREDKESIELVNRTAIEVHTASFRAVRGYSVACCIADELAFWRSDDSANPDTEILNAIRPAMATLDGKLICLSSPYARRGELYRAWRRYYGKPGPVLVAQAASRVMNPTLPEHVVEQAFERDEAAARAEYLAQFRNDIESFVSREAVEACIVDGRIELPFVKGNKYQAFTDPSGGSKDAWTLAIAHKENDKIVIDAIRSTKPPFSPDAVVKDYAGLLDEYRIKQVTGDRYGGEFPRELFDKYGITYEPAPSPKSDLYKNMLPHINSGKIELPDNEQLTRELVGLERRTARGGRDSIDHAPGSHDDLANAVAGAIITANARQPCFIFEALTSDTMAESATPWGSLDDGIEWR